MTAVPSQAQVLTGVGDLREAQVDVPLSVSHTCVWSHSWALWQTPYANGMTAVHRGGCLYTMGI